MARRKLERGNERPQKTPQWGGVRHNATGRGGILRRALGHTSIDAEYRGSHTYCLRHKEDSSKNPPSREEIRKKVEELPAENCELLHSREPEKVHKLGNKGASVLMGEGEETPAVGGGEEPTKDRFRSFWR